MIPRMGKKGSLCVPSEGFMQVNTWISGFQKTGVRGGEGGSEEISVENSFINFYNDRKVLKVTIFHLVDLMPLYLF